MRVKVRLETMSDINLFTEIVSQVTSDVNLIGMDENGKPWKLSAKSLLCSVLIVASQQQNRNNNAHNVDWNTIYCECDDDIYQLIQDFVI